MSTFAELRVKVSRDLRDPDAKTFDSTVIGDLINAALVEVGRIAPGRFQEDITPVADTLVYQLRKDDFPDGVPEVEVSRVELWDGSTAPPTFRATLRPASAEYVNASSVGWHLWGSNLELSNDQEEMMDPDTHLVRVWGYCPYPQLVLDADVVPVSPELEWAIRAYCRVESLRRLVNERDLFTQWQTRSNNADVSPAGLMNALSQAEADWQRRERKLFVLREH